MNYLPFYEDLFEFLKEQKQEQWLTKIQSTLALKFQENTHGDLDKWLNAYNDLPDISPDKVSLNSSFVGATCQSPLPSLKTEQLHNNLFNLSPWRKGPFNLFDIEINTEWRSDFKWDRIKDHISPLNNRLVLDVGCGSGYHAWRMLGAGAQRVIGIDPSNLFLFQFETIKKYCGPSSPIHYLPLRMEDLPPQLEMFDTTFSMGVLYHRKSPIDHLFELKSTLKQGGELVLETLVCEGELGHALMPENRYAMMRNVWFIPTIETLKLWLARAGFKEISCIEKNQTSLEEQRATKWMTFQSLADFLDPNDRNKTIEGYPAPLRATFIAKK